MQETLWQLIEESKKGLTPNEPATQFERLKKLLAPYSLEEIRQLDELWFTKRMEITKDPRFDALHASEGGIVDSGDDGFYMDFANWVIGQGKGLVEAFEKNGADAIRRYVEKHNVEESAYTYESMGYVFSIVEGERSKHVNS